MWPVRLLSTASHPGLFHFRKKKKKKAEEVVETVEKVEAMEKRKKNGDTRTPAQKTYDEVQEKRVSH